MSLTASLNTAISGLAVAQSGISVVSDNVANVNTKGYVRKEAIQSTVTLAGQGAGAEIEEIRRITNEFLNQEFRNATSEFGRFEAASVLHDQATALLGDPTGDNNLVGLLDKVLIEMGSLAANPETISVRTSALESIKRLAEDIESTSTGVRNIRRQADLRIGEELDRANRLLSDVHDLNLQISQRGASTVDAGLDDLRARKLDELSAIIGIRTAEQSDGRLLVSTTGGLPLIDSSLRQFVHTPSGNDQFGQSYAPLQLQRLDGTTGAVASTTANVDDRILSGELKGLLETRDGALLDLGVELGAFVGHLTEQINAVHNQFTAVPPPATLTGANTGALATDPHNFSGIAHFHAFDANNAIIATATVDFGVIGGTVNDVINAVNAGLGGAGTMSLTNGVMSFAAAGTSTGVAIEQDATTPADAAGRGFSHRFGLNDLVRTSVLPQFETGLQATSAHGFTGTAELVLTGPQNQRVASSSIDFGALGGTVGDLLTQLNTDFTGFATFTLSTDGELVATPNSSLRDFNVEVTTDLSARGGSGISMSNYFGLGSAAVSSIASDFSIRSDIDGNSALLSLASIDSTNTPAVFLGDNTGANALQALSFGTASFEGAGRIGSLTGTLTEIGGELLGRAGQAANDVEFRRGDRELLKEELALRVGEVSGVNIDEEMAQLIQLQAAFNAATRVISVTNEMIDALLRI